MDRPTARMLPLLATTLLLGACRAKPAVDWNSSHDVRARLSSETAESGSLRDRLARPDLADLVLLYGAEAGGALGP